MFMRKHGYSMIEIMFVLTFISLLLMIAVPYYIDYKLSSCDKMAHQDLVNIMAAWEQYLGDPLNKNEAPPTKLSDLTGPFYGWGGTSEKCDVRAYLDTPTLTVYTTPIRGSRPKGGATRFMYFIKMKGRLNARIDPVEPEKGVVRTVMACIGDVFSPSKAYAAVEEDGTSRGYVDETTALSWSPAPYAATHTASVFDASGNYRGY